MGRANGKNRGGGGGEPTPGRGAGKGIKSKEGSGATTYEERVAELEVEGETTSDAQGIADAENWHDDPMGYLRERRAARNAPSALDMRNEEHLLEEESRRYSE